MFITLRFLIPPYTLWYSNMALAWHLEIGGPNGGLRSSVPSLVGETSPDNLILDLKKIENLCKE